MFPPGERTTLIGWEALNQGASDANTRWLTWKINILPFSQVLRNLTLKPCTLSANGLIPAPPGNTSCPTSPHMTCPISKTHNLRDRRCHWRMCPQRTGPQSIDDLWLHATLSLSIKKIRLIPLGVSPHSIKNQTSDFPPLYMEFYFCRLTEIILFLFLLGSKIFEDLNIKE